MKKFLLFLFIVFPQFLFAAWENITLKIENNNVYAYSWQTVFSQLTRLGNTSSSIMYDDLRTFPAIAYRILTSTGNLHLVEMLYNDGNSWVTSSSYYVLDSSKKKITLKNITQKFRSKYRVPNDTWPMLSVDSQKNLIISVQVSDAMLSQNQSVLDKKWYILSEKYISYDEPMATYSKKITLQDLLR